MGEEEIDLRDYINVILKRKRVIITIFLLSVVITTIICFIMPKTYRAKALVENGFIGEPIISKSDAIEIINSEVILGKVIKTKKSNLLIKAEDISNIIKAEDIINTNMLCITANANTPRDAKKLCEEICKEYVAYGNKLYNEKRKPFDENLKLVEEQITRIDNDIVKVKAMIEKFSVSASIISSDEEVRIILLQSVLSAYNGQLQGLYQQKHNINIIFSKSKEFKIITHPKEPEYSIKPKKKQMIIISSILGLMAGVFIAFFVEFWQKHE